MNVFILLAHPEIQSFNGALFNESINLFNKGGAVVNSTDLYRSNFHPLSDRSNFSTCFDSSYLKLQLEEIHASCNNGFMNDVETEMSKIEACDLMIWQFPLWWFSVPSILKGWIDRVFAMGRMYDHEHVFQNGKLRGKRAMLSLTVGGEEAMYLKNGFLGDMDAILRPIHRGILQFVGFDILKPHITYAPVRMHQSERTGILTQFCERLAKIENEKPIDVGCF
ncbi:MAG: NAD(P)H-dependent oxidoreductase [Gammaproteobacteria bacterium]